MQAEAAHWLSATFQFRPKQQKASSTCSLLHFQRLYIYTIFTYTIVYPGNVWGEVCSGGGWRWWRHGRNRRRIGWAHTKSQETSLALWKWDTNVRGTSVLVHACVCVWVRMRYAAVLCQSQPQLQLYVRRECGQSTHAEKTTKQYEKCVTSSRQCVFVCVCVCVRTYLTYRVYVWFSVHLCVCVCSCKNNNTDRVCRFCSHY